MSTIAGMPHILHEETISSWLYRSTLRSRYNNQYLAGQSFMIPPPVSWGGPLVESSDWDFDPNTDFLKAAMENLAIDVNYAAALFFNTHGRVVDWARRWWFCAQCLRADIASGQAPGWRKHWCYRDSIVCSTHGADLHRLQVQPQLSRGWDAFIQCLQDRLIDPAWQCQNFQRFRVTIVNRVARWKLKQGKVTLDIFDNLYSVMLLAPVYNGNQGMAYELFGEPGPLIRLAMPNYLAGIKYGAEVASMKARFASLLLTGYLMGIVGDRDLAFVAAKDERFEAWRSYNLDLVSSMRFGCTSKLDFKLLESLLFGRGELPCDTLNRALRTYFFKLRIR